jgi:hypothetical protein
VRSANSRGAKSSSALERVPTLVNPVDDPLKTRSPVGATSARRVRSTLEEHFMTLSPTVPALASAIAVALFAAMPASAMPPMPSLQFPEKSGIWGCQFRGDCAPNPAGGVKE